MYFSPRLMPISSRPWFSRLAIYFALGFGGWSALNWQIGEIAAFSATTTPSGRAEIKAPEFSLKNMDGKITKLSDFKGKVVLLNFWATWCTPCRKEIPDLVKMHENFKKKGFVVLGISLDDDPSAVVPDFIKELKKETGIKINYPILIGDEGISDAYGGIRGIPTSFLVDRLGIVRRKFIGPPGTTSEEIEANFKSAITKLL